MVKDLFRDSKQTEFVIATIPSVLGVNESARLAAALRKDQIPCRRIVVNQVRQYLRSLKYLKQHTRRRAWRRRCARTR